MSRIVISISALSLGLGAHASNGLFPAGNGMIAHGIGGAGLANGAEAMSVVDNPSLIHRTGDMANCSAHFCYPQLSANVAGNYVTSDIEQAITPQAAITQTINEQLAWGVALTLLRGWQ